MGKGSKSSSKKGSSAKSNSCTCDHPYQCSCGNRPERPSKGHKWDPEAQAWGGKGHKQKGASGQTATIAKEASVTSVGKTAVAQWQRLPTHLLDDFCKRERRPRPKYKPLDRGVPSGKYKYRVIVQDAKANRRGGDHDVILIPSKPVENEEQAREEAALLALLHLTPSLPHERKLPEPYKTTWLHAVQTRKEQKAGGGAKKKAGGDGKAVSNDAGDADGAGKPPLGPPPTTASSTNGKSGGGRAVAVATTDLGSSVGYATNAEKRRAADEKRKTRLARIRKHEAIRLANRDHEVFMSSSVRKRIEALLRGDASEGAAAALLLEHDEMVDGRDDDDGENEDEADRDGDLRAYVIDRLAHEGFTRSQAKAAFAHHVESAGPADPNGDEDAQLDASYEDCLQFLCIHLDEDQLPTGFDPRGRTLDVVVAPTVNRSGESDDVEGGKAASERRSSSRLSSDDGRDGGGGDVGRVTAKVGVEAHALSKRFGISGEEATLVLKNASSSEHSDRVLWQALCKAAGVSLDDSNAAPTTDEDGRRNAEIASDEMEALQAIFPDDECTISKSDDGAVTNIVITMPSADGDVHSGMKLEVQARNGLYPDLYPIVFITGWDDRQIKEGRGVAVQTDLVRFLLELPQGDPMVYELYGHAQSLLQQDREESVAAGDCLSLLPHLDGGEEIMQKRKDTNKSRKGNGGFEAANGDAHEQKAKRKQQPMPPSKLTKTVRRPRERSVFWSKRPRDTPPAVAHPKLSTAMEYARKNLPAAKARSEFLSIMEKADRGGRCLLITGETGCGKTTQIPQFLLEEAPMDAKIVVAQPRRLAATGVASRVANERGESSPGEGSVGYVVRGDTAMCPSTRLMFCTTGVLLRQLQSDGALDSITHIVVDEVHERHLDSDVLLGVLKECLPKTPHLRVVLMSATMDADRFAAYWGSGTPRMHIPGFTFPVRDYTLEDVLSLTGYIPPKNGKKKKKKRSGGRGTFGRKLSAWNDSEKSDEEEDESIDSKSLGSETTSASRMTNPQSNCIPLEDLVERVNESDIDYDMIGVLVRHLLQTKQRDDDGSILVFLPGAPEIARADEAIRRIAKGTSINLLHLHGGLQPKDQQLVFRKANRGNTKVILSTNVAETSITIPDCTVVVDTCREKQSSYDPSNRMPLLLERFASRDSLKQRRGRAGRVRPGECYKLMSNSTHNKLPEHGEPEIRRCALDQTLLSLLFLGVERGSGNFLNTLLDPPGNESVQAAIFSLEKLGAVSRSRSDDLSLTPLGMHLAGIPAPPCVGKMLVMGSILRVRDAALAIAAGMSIGRSPFLRVDAFDARKRGGDEEEEGTDQIKQKNIIEERKKLFCLVGNSDHAMLAAAFQKWESLKAGGGEKKRFCDSLGLSFIGMREMKDLVKQLGSSLSAVGYFDSREANANANSWRIIRACVVSSLAPSQVVRVERPSTKYAETAEGSVEQEGNARELKFFIRSDSSVQSNGQSKNAPSLNSRYHGMAEERVFMHPSSANFAVGSYSCPWLVYHQLVRTSKAFLRDATECNSYALLLFGGKIEVQAANGIILVDGFVRLAANARIGALIGGLRRKIDDLLAKKVAEPAVDISGSVEMRIIVNLLMSDGLGK